MTKKDIKRLEELRGFFVGPKTGSIWSESFKYTTEDRTLKRSVSVRIGMEGGTSYYTEYTIQQRDPRCSAADLAEALRTEYRALLEKEKAGPQPVVSFRISFGTVSGYGVENAPDTSLSVVAEDIKKLADYNGTNPVKISGILSETRTVYATEWGCPIGGEKTFEFRGCQNPEFCEDVEAYKKAVRELARKIKKFYKQSTVTVEFCLVELDYLAD